MAFVTQAFSCVHQLVYSWLHPTPSKTPDALRLGIISTARINPTAIIHPSTSHPGIILYAIASRDICKAKQAQRRHSFTKAYGSYQDLLDDTDVDIVYISTPNALHYEWAKKAIEAGKHVLCERPLAANGEDVGKLVDLAKERGVVVEEANHWQLHPAAHVWRQILESNEYGKIVRTDAVAASPGTPTGDIRWRFDLGGGSAIDMTDAVSLTRFALHAKKPTRITAVSVRPASDPRIDEAMFAHLDFEGPRGNKVHSRVYTDMALSKVGGIIPQFWRLPSIEVEMEKATVYFYNAVLPHLYHYIAITDKTTGKTRYIKQYEGGPFWRSRVTSSGDKGGSPYWSTYRWQLEAFVDAVQGKTPAFWVSNKDSVWQMETIDGMYEVAGLPVRPSLGGKRG